MYNPETGQYVTLIVVVAITDQRHSISPSYSSSNSDSSTTCTSSTSQSPVKDQKVSSTGSTSSSNVRSKDHKHASNAHKPTRRPNNNGPPQVHPKDKPPEVSKCKKNPMVKMERIQSSGVNKTPPSSSKCLDTSTDKGKKLSNEHRNLVSEFSGLNSSSGLQESHMTPTTRALTVLSSTTVVSTPVPVVSSAKAALSAPKLMSVSSTNASSSRTPPIMHYSSSTGTGNSASTKKLQLTTVTVTTPTVTISKQTKPALTSQCSSGGSKKTSTRKTPLCKGKVVTDGIL